MKALGTKRNEYAGLTAPISSRDVMNRLRLAASRHGEELIAELPGTVRRIRTLILVMTVAVPVFLVALVVVLWRLAG
jgi:hypothetical protein